MEDLTYLLLIQDCSGSMGGLRTAVIENFNKLIAEQQSEKAPCLVSLVQFNSVYKEVFTDVPLAEVQPLTLRDYVTEGNTALFDAMGYGIAALGKRIDALPADKRPQRVMVVTHTDGHENHSKEYTREIVQSMVKANSEEGGWMFIFAGANIDAQKEGGDLGVASGGIASYAANLGGTQAVYGATSNAVMRSRRMGAQQYKSAVRMQSRGESAFNAAEIRAMSLGDVSGMASEVDPDAVPSVVSSSVAVPPSQPPKKATPRKK